MSNNHLTYLNLRWSNPRTTLKPEELQVENRWNYIKRDDNKKFKLYLIRLSNVTAEDAGEYLCHIRLGEIVDRNPGKTIEIRLRMKCILIF